MTDLLHILPDFPTSTYTHLLPSLEKHNITTTDLLTLEALEIAKRAHLPLLDLRRLTGHVLSTLQCDLALGKSDATRYDDTAHIPEPARRKTTMRASGKEVISQRLTISTLDPSMDNATGGGIPTGYITEIVGER